jgi:hypothetical protein
MPDLSQDTNGASAVVHPRPTPLPCDLRPIWRIAALVLILNQCRQRRATIEQLHVMNWSIRSRKAQDQFLAYIQGLKSPNEVVVRYDPSLTRAIDFALGAGIVERYEKMDGIDDGKTQYRLTLSQQGEALAGELMEDEDIFVTEKAFLQDIGRKITQKQIADLFKWRR